MVWFDDSLRFPLCEAGIDGFVILPFRTNSSGISGHTLEPFTGICTSGIDGFTPGLK